MDLNQFNTNKLNLADKDKNKKPNNTNDIKTKKETLNHNMQVGITDKEMLLLKEEYEKSNHRMFRTFLRDKLVSSNFFSSNE